MKEKYKSIPVGGIDNGSEQRSVATWQLYGRPFNPNLELLSEFIMFCQVSSGHIILPYPTAKICHLMKRLC